MKIPDNGNSTRIAVRSPVRGNLSLLRVYVKMKFLFDRQVWTIVLVHIRELSLCSRVQSWYNVFGGNVFLQNAVLPFVYHTLPKLY